jgi:hypothetical protein
MSANRSYKQQIGDELRARVGDLRFGLERREVDYAAWVEEVLTSPEWAIGGIERGVGRAESWIRAGYPEPPGWFRTALKGK